MGGKPENCVTFFLPKGVKRTVSRDKIKIFEFCKMFWIANIASDIVNRKKLFVSFIWFLLNFVNFDVLCKKFRLRNGSKI